MNNRFRYPAWLILASAVAPFVSGQAVTAPAAASDASDDTVVLSPFTVAAERDTGYQAQSTLAGSRLATPLKDIGAAISVYTKDFMNDIGATNANELLVFATGMEAGGSQGNFSGLNVGIGEAQPVGDGPRTNPQSGSRTRGLGSPSFTRNYFLTNIAIDGYNTSAVTVNRGPNAILFGVGSPAGIVENSLITANLARDRNVVELRVGDTGSLRSSIDLNRVLIPRTLAVRIAALDDQERYQQKPAFENKSRLFGTATYQPFRSTTLSANFETGKTRANRPITVLPFDSINQAWYAAGRPVYDWTFFDDPARNPSAAAQNAGTLTNRFAGIGQAQIFGAIIIPYDNRTPNGGPGPSFRSTTPATTSTTNPGANQLRAQIFHPVLNRDTANDTIAFYETFNVGEGSMPASLFPGGVRPAGQKMQGFTNYEAFDFRRRQIDETSRQGDDFRTFNVSLAQTAWKNDDGVDRVGIELAYNFERYERHANNAFFAQGNGNHVRLDTNVTLPDGRPNPNLGRPYASGAAAAQLNYLEAERENRRATAFLKHDFNHTFRDSTLGRWLGRHTVTGLYEEYRNDNLSSSTRLRMFGQAAEAIGVLPTNFNRLPNAVVYLGDPIHTGAPLRLEPIRIRPLTGGQTTNTSWFRAPQGLVNGQLTQGEQVVTESSVVEGINDARLVSELIKSQAFILQSYWAMDHVITTVGWRKDEDYVLRFPTRNYNTDPQRQRLYMKDFDIPSDLPFSASGETLSTSIVLRWPQRLVRLPRGMDASIFFNKSENFTPDGGRINAFNENIPPPAGETDEYGVSLTFFDDQLSFRVNRFETSQVNASRGGTYGGALNNYWRQLIGFWNQQENATPQFSRWADAQRALALFPDTAALLNFQRVVDPATGRAGATETPLPTFSDTQDFVAKGTEMELVYNPTRRWRIALNVANQETTLSNLAPAARRVHETLIPFWNEYRNTPLQPVEDWGGPGVPYPSTAPQHLGTLVQRDVLIPYATLLAQEGAVSAEQRKWRANLVTNYRFANDTILEGFSVGTGVRWQGKYALGYPTSFRPDGSVFVDIANPYWSDDDLNVDAWLGYTRKIYHGRINWRVQLNVRNLIGDPDPIAITVQPDGSPAVTRLPPERRVFLTNTFEF
jgi:hypothetical protein